MLSWALPRNILLCLKEVLFEKKLIDADIFVERALNSSNHIVLFLVGYYLEVKIPLLVVTTHTLYLQSSPPDKIMLLIGFQSTFMTMPSWAFHLRKSYNAMKSSTLYCYNYCMN